MGIFQQQSKMDSRKQFLDTIRREYYDLTQGKVGTELLDAVSQGITDFYYYQYQRFRKQYPKSIRRYSSFQVKDLDHPNTHELIIKIIKDKVGNEYSNPAAIFLNMTVDELKEFEKSREEFYKIF